MILELEVVGLDTLLKYVKEFSTVFNCYIPTPWIQ